MNLSPRCCSPNVASTPLKAVELNGSATPFGFFGAVHFTNQAALQVHLRFYRQHYTFSVRLRSARRVLPSSPLLSLALAVPLAVLSLVLQLPATPELAFLFPLFLGVFFLLLRRFPHILRYHTLEHRTLEAVARWAEGERWEDHEAALRRMPDTSWACGSLLVATSTLFALPLLLFLPLAGAFPLSLALGDLVREWAKRHPDTPFSRSLLRFQQLFLLPPTEEELRAGARLLEAAVEALQKRQTGSR